MRTKIVFALNILIIISMSATLIYQFFFAEEKDWKIISKAGTLLIVYGLGVLGVHRKRSPLDFTLYKEQYGFVLGNAFANDKSAYMGLMSAITLYNRDKYHKAIKKLNKLEERCSEADDFTAVLYFRALCNDESGNPKGAIADYEDLLVRNYTHSHAWSNLGLLYMNEGRFDDAFRAYSEAVSHNPQNYFAHTNLGHLHLHKGNAESALECAERAIEVSPKFHQAMSLAAVACKILGDMEGVERYSVMYSANGGKKSELKKTLEMF